MRHARQRPASRDQGSRRHLIPTVETVAPSAIVSQVGLGNPEFVAMPINSASRSKRQILPLAADHSDVQPVSCSRCSFTAWGLRRSSPCSSGSLRCAQTLQSTHSILTSHNRHSTHFRRTDWGSPAPSPYHVTSGTEPKKRLSANWRRVLGRNPYNRLEVGHLAADHTKSNVGAQTKRDLLNGGQYRKFEGEIV